MTYHDTTGSNVPHCERGVVTKAMIEAGKAEFVGFNRDFDDEGELIERIWQAMNDAI